MLYEIFGCEIEIISITHPVCKVEGVYEFHGSNSLNKIWLKEKFWFKSPDYFCNTFPEKETDFTDGPKYLVQTTLASYLRTAIEKEEIL